MDEATFKSMIDEIIDDAKAGETVEDKVIDVWLSVEQNGIEEWQEGFWAGHMIGLRSKANGAVKQYLFDITGQEHYLDGLTTEIAFGHWGVANGRKPITDDPWPYTVETCAFSKYTHWYWTRQEDLLFCPGCGLDGT